jgi:hypothetical protein
VVPWTDGEELGLRIQLFTPALIKDRSFRPMEQTRVHLPGQDSIVALRHEELRRLVCMEDRSDVQ